MTADQSSSSPALEPQDAQAVHRAIFERRDVRHFAGGCVAPEQLRCLLGRPSSLFASDMQ